MKKVIFVIIILVFSVCYKYTTTQSRPRYWHKCINGYLYYDWTGRRLGVVIPVLNKKTMEMIRCHEK
jgi:hypothetical protein